MGLKESLEKSLQKGEDRLIRKLNDFATETGIKDKQVLELVEIAMGYYKHGLETLDSGKGTDYSRLQMLARLNEFKKTIKGYLR